MMMQEVRQWHVLEDEYGVRLEDVGVMENWARWQGMGLLLGQSGLSRCRSAEGRYVSEEKIRSVANVYGPPVDAESALCVERAARYLPEKLRVLLVNHYVYRSNMRAVCRALAIRFCDYKVELRRAVTMTVNRTKALGVAKDGGKVYKLPHKLTTA